MKTLLIGIVMAAVLAIASTASGYDRKPVTISGAHGDGWGQTINNAQQAIRARYRDAGFSYCVGAILADDRANSSWIYGYSRFWDKLVCYVETGSHAAVTFVFDPKGAKQNAYTIYRLRHLNI